MKRNTTCRPTRKTKVKRDYQVIVTYPAKLYFEQKCFEFDIAIENLAPSSKNKLGAGMGMGERDICFYKLTAKEADTMVAKVKTLRVRGLKNVKACVYG